MSWKNVQYENGKFKTSPGGGGGASALTDLDDVNISSASNGQVLKYNGTSNKWENANESGGSVTDVQVDGTSVVNGQGIAVLTTPNVSNLKDTNISNPSSGQTLQFNATNNKWENVTPASGGNVDDVKVNGSSVVDSNKVAQIKSYKEVTQAEYNALPASKTSDGVLYCIKDAGGADSFPPLIYSDEEREVGVWRDGKPLYQKTFIVNQLTISSNSSASITISDYISNVEKIIAIPSVRISSINYVIPNVFMNSSLSVYGFGVAHENTTIIISRGNTGSSYTGDYEITLQYTKTTDVAGSGSWTTHGTPTHHYSTTEQVIGTWIDGKPLYEITITAEHLTRNSNWQTIAHGIANIDKIVHYFGRLYITSDQAYWMIPAPRVGGTNGYSLYIDRTNIKYINILHDTNTTEDVSFVIQYTKTTD